DTGVDLKAQAQCESYVTTDKVAPPEAEATCLVNAKRGLPSAEFALGAILLSRQRFAEGFEWLEKAAATRHPPASHLLAEVYLQSNQASLEARGKELLRFAICAGYPPAASSKQ